MLGRLVCLKITVKVLSVDEISFLSNLTMNSCKTTGLQQGHAFKHHLLHRVCLTLSINLLLLNKLPFPDVGTPLVPYLRLQQAVSGPSVMMWLQLRLPEFKQREEHCRHDGCLTNARGLQSQKHSLFKSTYNLHL